MIAAGRRFWEAAGREWWVEPSTVAEFRCIPSWRVLPRTIPDYMLWYIRSGIATLTMGDHDYPLRAGDVLFVPPGELHSADHDPTCPLWTVTIHFTFRDAASAVVSVPRDDLPPVRCAAHEPHVFDTYISRLLILEALRPPEWRPLARALLLVVLTELQREHAQTLGASAVNRAASSAIAQALLRLEMEGEYYVTPGSLAQACGFSPAYFSRLFRQQFGCTPQHYLIARRIKRARHLLLESDLSVEQVAHTLGYRDVYFFTRQFKAQVGQPPAIFRRTAHP